MKNVNTHVNFKEWTDDDIGLKTTFGGGCNYNQISLADDDNFAKCISFSKREELFHRIKFIKAIKYADSGNTYKVSALIKLAPSSACNEATAMIGVMGLLDMENEYTENFTVTKNEWTKCEFTFVLKDKTHNCLSIEQAKSDKTVADFLISEYDVELLKGEPLEEKETIDLSFKNSGKTTIHLVGDSIVTNYSDDSPIRGWGMYLQEYFDKEKINVNNQAVAGYSTKTFFKVLTGIMRWDHIKQNIKPGDYIFISLGINDESSSSEYTQVSIDEYKGFLQRFIDEVKDDGVTVVLITPTLTVQDNPIKNFRRHRADAMIEVAKNNNADGRNDLFLLDLNAYMAEELKKLEASIGYDEIVSKYYGIDKNGNHDITHHCEYGSRWVLSLIIDLLKKSDCPLKTEIIK